MRPVWCVLGLVLAAPLMAQESGTLTGRVRDRDNQAPIEGAVVTLNRRASVTTDTSGAYRFRAVRSGWHRVEVRALGATPMVRESVLVRAGETTTLDFLLVVSQAVRPIDVVTAPDVVLDPLAIATTQRVTSEDLRTLPVTTVEEAVQLSAGAVGESYRGGRAGQQSFILDGLGVKNQLDASTGGLGIRIPPDILTEASLVTNGFSARYGQALSGLINVVTKEGSETWNGRLAYESDRALPAGWDMGLDRLVLQGDGPLGRPSWGVRFLGAVDASGRLDADPVNAPPPGDSRDPRSQRPNLLPHNSGELLDGVAKLTFPLGSRQTVRLFALRSLEQRLLYDPAFKYDLESAPARRVTGTLVSGHWQYAAGSRSATTVVADLRLARFTREFMRGILEARPDARFGAFTGERLRFVGEDMARSQDTAAASAAIPGFERPDFSVNTPWGVPAFFLGQGSRGDLAWNRFEETRGQLDLNLGAGRDADFYLGGELGRQNVRTFQRALAYLPVQPGVPPASAARFSPVQAAAYGEFQVRSNDIAFTIGARYDRFDSRALLTGEKQPEAALSPRLGISAVLRGATVVVSWGRFHQAPDFQYLVDAAFDDTVRTGRFRIGNPSLGFEEASQYEFSVRARPSPITSLRVNAFAKRLTGLVASVPFGLDPDSTLFGNTDFGTVQGMELLFERELTGGWGARVSYTFQKAEATAGNAFQLFQRIRIAPTGTDTVIPARVEFPLDYDRRHGLIAIVQAEVSHAALPGVFGARIIRGLEAAAVVRYSSGLPYSRTNPTGDTLLGLPNSSRLPSQSTVDVLLRRGLRLRGLRGSFYVDARNLLNRRNTVAVRRDSGEPGLGPLGLEEAAQAAWAEHPEPIPYESPRYRAWADTDGDGLVAGAELLPLYQAAARDYFQPLFAYGPPRLVRIGVEVIF